MRSILSISIFLLLTATGRRVLGWALHSTTTYAAVHHIVFNDLKGPFQTPNLLQRCQGIVQVIPCSWLELMSGVSAQENEHYLNNQCLETILWLFIE